MVINYEYLWHSQYDAGMENGVKTRPCIVVRVKDTGSVMVVPITHHPQNMKEAVEIPAQTSARLGLDEQKSYIVCSELNQFKWAGPDVHLIPNTNSCVYGVLPTALYNTVTTKIGFLGRGRHLRVVSRTDTEGKAVND